MGGVPRETPRCARRGKHARECRRPADDDSDRASKRSSREKGHRGDCSRRSSDKEKEYAPRGKPERRQREREDGPEKPKCIPEGPAAAVSPLSPTALPALCAMAANNSAVAESARNCRPGEREREPPTEPGSFMSRIGGPVVYRGPGASGSFRSDPGDARGQCCRSTRARRTSLRGEEGARSTTERTAWAWTNDAMIYESMTVLCWDFNLQCLTLDSM
ncbi:hypothetical protein BC834DRAFT_623128 [Gloeopeniophorella convolvens]|nr:hypothetical protein BC834DRAFT_623128 [Gloeopeniophorella convolvens]